MIKTPAELAHSKYCDVHGLYFERFCPDCRLEEWATFKDPGIEQRNFTPLKEGNEV